MDAYSDRPRTPGGSRRRVRCRVEQGSTSTYGGSEVRGAAGSRSIPWRGMPRPDAVIAKRTRAGPGGRRRPGRAVRPIRLGVRSFRWCPSGPPRRRVGSICLTDIRLQGRHCGRRHVSSTSVTGDADHADGRQSHRRERPGSVPAPEDAPWEQRVDSVVLPPHEGGEQDHAGHERCEHPRAGPAARFGRAEAVHEGDETVAAQPTAPPSPHTEPASVEKGVIRPASSAATAEDAAEDRVRC